MSGLAGKWSDECVGRRWHHGTCTMSESLFCCSLSPLPLITLTQQDNIQQNNLHQNNNTYTRQSVAQQKTKQYSELDICIRQMGRHRAVHMQLRTGSVGKISQWGKSIASANSRRIVRNQTDIIELLTNLHEADSDHLSTHPLIRRTKAYSHIA